MLKLHYLSRKTLKIQCICGGVGCIQAITCRPLSVPTAIPPLGWFFAFYLLYLAPKQNTNECALWRGFESVSANNDFGFVILGVEQINCNGQNAHTSGLKLFRLDKLSVVSSCTKHPHLRLSHPFAVTAAIDPTNPSSFSLSTTCLAVQPV
jgi:hypothetical protein